MAFVVGFAVGTLRTLAVAAIAAAALVCAAAPVHAAPADPGLEKLWKEFPLDERPAATIPRGEPAGDRADAAPPPAVRRSSQPEASEAMAPSGDDIPRALLVFMTLALLLVLGATAVALPHVAVATAPLRGRRTLASRPRERPRRHAGFVVGDARDEVRPDQLGGVASRPASRTVDDLLRATAPQRRRTTKRGVLVDTTQSTRKAADEPTTRELREVAKAGRALEPDAGASKLKQPADEHAKRDRREHPKASPALKTDPDARKLKQAADEQAKRHRREDDKAALTLKPDPHASKLKGEGVGGTDPLKLSGSEAREGSTSDALKEKLATPPGDDLEALKRPVTGRGTRRRLARGNRRALRGGPALRPLPGRDETSRRDHASRVATQPIECGIRRWRGYVTTQFYAVATAPDGTETIVRSSPSFHWLRSDLPETPEASAALGTLVASLQQEGWRVDGQGDEWFSVRLRQTQVGLGVSPSGPRQ